MPRQRAPQEPKHDLRTWIEIDTAAIAHNYNMFRSHIGEQVNMMAVVKSNAYGHGLVPFALTLKELGVDWFGVDSITEGLTLRKEGIRTPILVLGYTRRERIKDALGSGISLTISSLDMLKTACAVAKQHKKKIKVHIKVDTGMHRQGFFFSEHEKVLATLKDNCEHVIVEGLYTHFAAAKNPAVPAYTQKQIEEFKKWKSVFEESGFSPIVHASATSGTILFPEAHFDMVRIGIGLYGLYPSEDVRASAHTQFALAPVLSWKTIVSEIKQLPTAAGIGYDLTETVPEKTKLAVCPIGYWHGYPRALSSVGYVLVKGKEARVVGRVSMDMIVLDVTDIRGVREEDEVVLIGKETGIEAGEVARVAGTVNYELITQLNPLMRRFYE